MSALVEFLLARIAEDVEAAQFVVDDTNSGAGIFQSDDFFVTERSFVERFSPARVLADCEAKRRIAALHRIESERELAWRNRPDGLQELAKVEVYSCVICGWVMEDGPEPVGVAGCPTLLALAAPYSDHPDFDPSWGVSGG